MPWSAGAPSGILARAQLRIRWRALVALGLLAGVTAGFAAAALAGGLRSRTALDRLEEREHAADAVVFPGQVNLLTADWGRLAEEPEIEQIAVWALLFGNFDLDALPPEERETAALGARTRLCLGRRDLAGRGRAPCRGRGADVRPRRRG